MSIKNSVKIGSLIKALLRGIYKILCAIGRGLCRVAGSFLALTLAAVILYTQFPRIQEAIGLRVINEITDTAVYEELNAISEFAVYEFAYTNHVDFTNSPELLGRDVWGTDHWFAFDYSGVIKVGCNFDEIDVILVDPVSRSVILHMPDVCVLSNEIHVEMDTYEDRNNICNPLQPSEVLEYLYSRREPEENKAIELGILDLGADNIRSLVSLAIRGLGYEAVFR